MRLTRLSSPSELKTNPLNFKTMNKVDKASDRLDARSIDNKISGDSIIVSVQDIFGLETYELTISQEEVKVLADEYDAMTEDNQHQHQA